jgi:hypothetical protein
LTEDGRVSAPLTWARHAASPIAPPERLARPRRVGPLVVAFGAVHAWLAFLGRVLRPESTFDVELYRRWVEAGLQTGTWPVLDQAWVYPVGALVPTLVGAPVAASPAGFALAWFALVTVLDAAALAVLVTSTPRGHEGAWWWLAATAALGPVALGRLDGVVVPLTVVALALARRRPAFAATLLTLGAWVKVAPGAVLLPLALVARRPWRTVALPAAVVTAVVAGAALAAGAGARLLSFLTAQGSRGLQIESVAATPYSLARWWNPGVWTELNIELNTYEVRGVDTAAVRAALDVALVLGVAAVAWLVWRATRSPGSDRFDVLLTSALAVELVLVVANKVGSPQFVAWLLAPVAVALAHAGWTSAWRLPAFVVLVVAALTQWLFPLAYLDFLAARGPVVVVAAVRNLLLVVLLVGAVRTLVRAAVARRAAATVTP